MINNPHSLLGNQPQALNDSSKRQTSITRAAAMNMFGPSKKDISMEVNISKITGVTSQESLSNINTSANIGRKLNDYSPIKKREEHHSPVERTKF